MTTALLNKIREQDQEALADRYNGSDVRAYKSEWVITTLSRYLSPEQVDLAKTLARLQATIEGCRIVEGKVDNAANKAELAIIARMDAMRELSGYEAAARHRVKVDAAGRCVRSIAQSDHMGDLGRACGYPNPSASRRSIIRLVQLTLIALEAYRDENAAQTHPSIRAGEERACA